MGDKDRKFNLAERFIIQMTSGAGAGMAEVSLTHPIDTIKTRMQLQETQIAKTYHPKMYFGIIDCIYKMMKYEGVFSIWKGIVPALVVEIPRNGIKTYFLAGMGGGVTETLIITPFEVVKTIQQAGPSLEAASSPSNMEIVKKILRKYGIGWKGLYRGLTATIMREALYSAITFGFYFNMKKQLSYIKDPLHLFIRDMSLGFVAGLIAGSITTPFDIAKCKIQGPQQKPYIFSTLTIIRNIYHNDGIRGLYAGMIPRMLRLSFGASVAFLCYDRINLFMRKLVLNVETNLDI